MSEKNSLPESQNILHPNTPKVTTFNKKVVMILSLVIGVVCFFAVLTAFTPKIKNNAQLNNQIADDNTTQKNTSLPDELNNAPSSYQDINQQGSSEDTQNLYNGQFDNQVPNLDGQNYSGAPVPPVGDANYTAPDFPAPPNPNTYSGNQSYNPYAYQESPAQKEAEDAKRSSIRFGNNGGGSNFGGNTNLTLPQQQPQVYSQMQQQPQGDQDDKIAFIKGNQVAGKDYATSGLKSQLSKFELKAGSIIPATMITGINSDLPGRIIGQVRENVYDSTSGKYLLIPQGTKIIGTYDSKIVYNQSRILIVWNRLIFPNGDSLDLEGLTGTDTQGYAGMTGKVNNHTGKLIGGIILSSVFSAGAKVASGSQNQNPSYGQLAAEGAAENVSSVGQKLAEKNLNVQPTIMIRPGSKFNILVDKDFILRAYKR